MSECNICGPMFIGKCLHKPVSDTNETGDTKTQHNDLCNDWIEQAAEEYSNEVEDRIFTYGKASPTRAEIFEAGARAALERSREREQQLVGALRECLARTVYKVQAEPIEQLLQQLGYGSEGENV